MIGSEQTGRGVDPRSQCIVVLQPWESKGSIELCDTSRLVFHGVYD